MKTHIFKNIITTLIIITFFNKINAQGVTSDQTQFTPNITPPSPIAYALGNYGNIPVGMFTGSPNLNIPIFNFKTNNVEVPIYLFYTSNGVKVDEISSNVGQSWNINLSGVINRVVRDLPDEDRVNAPLPIPMSMMNELSNSSPQALEFFKSIGESEVDSEADLFSFNFGGYSGKFIIKNDDSIMLMPQQAIKFEFIYDESPFNFTATTPDGIKYYFNDKETSVFRNYGSGHSLPNIVTTSWYLSKIVHPKGDEIYFTYQNSTTSYNTSESQTLKELYPFIQRSCSASLNASINLSSIVTNKLTIVGKELKSITSKNNIFGKINFNYISNLGNEVISGNRKISEIIVLNKDNLELEKVNFNYFATINSRIFLEKVQFRDIEKKYIFEYLDKENLPKALTRSQDHWGYFNGQNNQNLVPANVKAYDLNNVNYNGANKEPNGSFAEKGMLSKIIYPTKGYTTFEYEANDYYFGDKLVYPAKINSQLAASLNEGEFNKIKNFTFLNLTNQEIEINGSLSFSCADPNLNTLHNRGIYSVEDLTDNQMVVLYSFSNIGNHVNNGTCFIMTPNMSIDQKKNRFTAIANHNYKITLQAKYECTSTSINFTYYPTAPTTVQVNEISGGVRIKKTTDYDNFSNNFVSKRFFYASKNNLSISSGNKGKTPYYLDFTQSRILCESGIVCDFKDIFYLNLTSDSIVNLFDTGTSNTVYKNVVVSYGNDNFINGGEENEFTVNRDLFGQTVLGNFNIMNAPFTNYGYNNGNLLNKKIFNSNDSLSKEVINQYEEDLDLRKEEKSYFSRKYFDLICSGSVTYVCNADDVNKIFNVAFPGQTPIYKPHACYGKTVGSTVIYQNNMENIGVMAYKNISYRHYLKSTIEKTYNTNGLNPIEKTTIFNYNNPNHLQLTSQSIATYNNDTIETKFFYPDELIIEPFMNDLKLANRISSPIKTEKWKNGIKTSEQKTVYSKDETTSNLLLPKYILSGKENNLENKITYDQYDDKGNINQYTPENGIPISVIWGYNKTKPIAKIENLDYVAIPATTINDLQTKSNEENDHCTTIPCTGKEEILRVALNALRLAYPNAMITTYTYDPLIGITTITDPKGDQTTYNYDLFNRLQYVKDKNGKILSENEYHYKR